MIVLHTHAPDISEKNLAHLCKHYTRIVNKNTHPKNTTNSPTIQNEINIRKKLVKKFDIQFFISSIWNESEREREREWQRKKT